MYARLVRVSTGNEGTLGWLLVGRAALRTIELPWRDNERNKSCIPTGEYRVDPRVSNRFGRCWWVRGVPGRSYILIHAGNWAGDEDLAYRTDSYGCILPGMMAGRLAGQLAVHDSLVAKSRIMDEAGHKDSWTLKIIEAYGD